MEILRIWNEVDINNIINSVLIVDEQLGFCPGCKRVGIKIDNIKVCPGCGRDFKYATARDAKGVKGFETVARIIRKLPGLIFIDYEDYERLTRRNKAEGLFGGI